MQNDIQAFLAVAGVLRSSTAVRISAKTQYNLITIQGRDWIAVTATQDQMR